MVPKIFSTVDFNELLFLKYKKIKKVVNIFFTISKLFSLLFSFVPEVHTSLKCVLLTNLKIPVKAHNMYFNFDNFLYNILRTIVNLLIKKFCF